MDSDDSSIDEVVEAWDKSFEDDYWSSEYVAPTLLSVQTEENASYVVPPMLHYFGPALMDIDGPEYVDKVRAINEAREPDLDNTNPTTGESPVQSPREGDALSPLPPDAPVSEGACSDKDDLEAVHQDPAWAAGLDSAMEELLDQQEQKRARGPRKRGRGRKNRDRKGHSEAKPEGKAKLPGERVCSGRVVKETSDNFAKDRVRRQ